MSILYTRYRHCQVAIAIILCVTYADPMSRPSLHRKRIQLTLPAQVNEALRAMSVVDGITMSAVVERALRTEHIRWKRKVSMGEFRDGKDDGGTPTHPKSAATTFSGQLPEAI
jgi:hypothetical protein